MSEPHEAPPEHGLREEVARLMALSRKHRETANHLDEQLQQLVVRLATLSPKVLKERK